MPPVSSKMLPTELHAQLMELLEGAGSSAVVGNTKMIRKMLLLHNISWKIVIKCIHIGIHGANRGGYGATPAKAASNLQNVFETGFDPEELKAICSDINPMQQDAEEARNMKIVSDANGKLAPILPGQLKYSALAGTHTNQGFRLAWYKMPHACAKITIDGHLSLDKIRVSQPALASAIENGVEWEVIPYWVLEAYPQLAHNIQSGSNTPQQVAAKENDFQIFRYIRDLARVTCPKTGNVIQKNYKDMEQALLRSKPPNAAAAPYMFTFYLKFGGGTDMPLIIEVETVVRSMCEEVRSVQSELYEAMATDCKGVYQTLRMRQGCMFLAFLHSNAKVLTPNDVKRLGSKDMMPTTIKADQFIKEVIAVVTDDPQQADLIEVKQVLAQFTMDIVLIVLGKRPEEETMETSAYKCIHDISEIAGRPHLSTKWDASKPIEAVNKKKSASSSSMHPQPQAIREYTSGGVLVNAVQVILQEIGFESGQRVMRKQDKQVFVISYGAADDDVLLTAHDGTTQKTSVGEFQDGKYKQADEEKTVEELANWTQHMASNSIDFNNMVCRSEIALMVRKVNNELLDMNELVKIITKPKPISVVTKTVIKKGDLVLTPATTNIVAKAKGSKDMPKNGIRVGERDGYVFFLIPQFTEPTNKKPGFIAPYWLVQSTEDENEANMSTSLAKTMPTAKPRDANDFVIPLLKNSVKLEEGVTLKVFKPKKVSGATIADVSATKKRKVSS
jgi:hypothetical protein